MFGQPEEDSDLPNPIKALFQQQQLHQACDKDLGELCSRQSEKAENELLMPLWKVLGDSSESYWISMKGVVEFAKIKKAIDNMASEIPADIMVTVLRALANHCEHAATSTIEAKRIMEKHYPDNHDD